MLVYINFYDVKDPYGWASNFYPKSFIIDGELWKTTEHYFQAMKFRDFSDSKSLEYSNIIRDSDSPAKVKALGTQKKHRFGKNWVINKITDNRLMNSIIDEYKDVKIRSDWERVKILVMIKAISYKFNQPDMKKLLIEIPDNALMVEHTPRDSFWGDGGDGKGLNMLGKILTSFSHIYKYGNCENMPIELKEYLKKKNKKVLKFYLGM